MDYGNLPITGLGVVVVGGVAVSYPIVGAAVAAVLIATGLVLRFVLPARIDK